MSSDATVRIGGASGYWGDTASGPRQLAERGGLDFMVFDYLAEATMAVLAKARARDSEKGYATDFIDLAMRPLLARLMTDGVRVVANAGGVNLEAARKALEAVARDLGVAVKIATVEGDDLLGRAEAFRGLLRPIDPAAPLPERLASLNAYLGAFPIARALDAGAQIVLTGRCVDSALILGPLIHAFGWGERDYDLLAQGSLCGHLLECGAQATGGNFTDWRDTEAGWADMGFPIAEVSADGGFVMTKPEGTGGAVTRLTVAEQLVYEIGDPAAYLLPDVICDFRAVTLTQAGPDRVLVEGAKGLAPPPTVKVTATYFDGFASRGASAIVGVESHAKAGHMARAILAKAEASVAATGLAPFSDTRLDVLSGADEDPSDNRPRWGSSVFRLAVTHESARGAELFAREFTGAGLSMSPGITPLQQGRPSVSPLIRVASFLLDKAEVSADVRCGGEAVATMVFEGPYGGARADAAPQDDPAGAAWDGEETSLLTLAVARSGDKGNDANIGVIARDPALLPAIRAQLTPQRVGALFGAERVERYDLPGIAGLNFVLRDVLGGGGPGSLHLDPLAKTFAQRLLALTLRAPSGAAKA
ncbi:MAG: putative ATPase [Caulobacter sp.]|nr:putative ATPase [Caulobacter sp.]